MINLAFRMPWSAEIAKLRLEMILAQDRYSVEEITTRRFTEIVGRPPIQDDLARCNCDRAGEPGHYSCGWDTILNVPFFMSDRLNTRAITKEHFRVRATNHPSGEPKEEQDR